MPKRATATPTTLPTQQQQQPSRHVIVTSILFVVGLKAKAESESEADSASKAVAKDFRFGFYYYFLYFLFCRKSQHESFVQSQLRKKQKIGVNIQKFTWRNSIKKIN